jgi:hypothetical protein
MGAGTVVTAATRSNDVEFVFVELEELRDRGFVRTGERVGRELRGRHPSKRMHALGVNFVLDGDFASEHLHVDGVVLVLVNDLHYEIANEASNPEPFGHDPGEGRLGFFVGPDLAARKFP